MRSCISSILEPFAEILVPSTAACRIPGLSLDPSSKPAGAEDLPSAPAAFEHPAPIYPEFRYRAQPLISLV